MLLLIIYEGYGQKIKDTMVLQKNHKFDKNVPDIFSLIAWNNIHELGVLRDSNSNSFVG
jgi:hypothetical protein